MAFPLPVGPRGILFWPRLHANFIWLRAIFKGQLKTYMSYGHGTWSHVNIDTCAFTYLLTYLLSRISIIIMVIAIALIIILFKCTSST